MSPRFERMMLPVIVSRHAQTEKHQRRPVIGRVLELYMGVGPPDDARCSLLAAYFATYLL